MKKIVLCCLVVLAALLLVGSGRASANVVYITSGGTWSASSPTTDLCAPNTPWTLTLEVDSPLPGGPSTVHNAPVVSGSYQLGTAAPFTSFAKLTFYYFSGGGFDLLFSNPDDSGLGVQGSPLFDLTTSELISGVYPAQSFQASENGALGSCQASLVVSSVPEPSTWAMLGVGLIGASVVVLRRRQTVRG